jgi:hypothetical protein
VPEYVYIDSRRRKGQTIWELAGFRLEEGHYLPMLPDEDGALYCESVGLRIGLENGEVWLEDVETGQELLTNRRAQLALRTAIQARMEAEAHAQAEAQARRALEERLAALEARLDASDTERK